MKFASLLIKSGLTVAGAGLYLLVKRFVRKAKRTTKDAIEKVEDTIEKVGDKLEKKSTDKLPQGNVNIPIAYV